MAAPRAEIALALAFLLRFGAALGQEDRVEKLAREHIAKRHIPGVAVALLRDGKVVHAGAYGLACIEFNAMVS